MRILAGNGTPQASRYRQNMDVMGPEQGQFCKTKENTKLINPSHHNHNKTRQQDKTSELGIVAGRWYVSVESWVGGLVAWEGQQRRR